MGAAAEHVEDSRRRVAPPFRPDPSLVGNAEGNQRVLKHDRAAAQRIVDALDQVDAGRLDRFAKAWQERLAELIASTFETMDALDWAESPEERRHREIDVVHTPDDQHWVVVLRDQEREGDIVVGQTFETQVDAQTTGQVLLKLWNRSDVPARDIMVHWLEVKRRIEESEPKA